ncbi:hypothetical protein [Rathayibacter agropyri]|uniref:hypothetical protein n=1 Tax=Rathayibacter agropyri TaxID=1634927 RepID=UPI00156358FC|nr:hypothetical protein [Rathayibacter agropyri]NRD08831.1 hypothetical protein [Rathayibacter agropyri]
MTRARSAALPVLAVPLLLAGCALPGDAQEAAPCAVREEAWNAYAAEPDSEHRVSLREALDGFEYSSSSSTATDAARLATVNLLDALSGERRAVGSFWNALDLIDRECTDAGRPLTLHHRGEPLAVLREP